MIKKNIWIISQYTGSKYHGMNYRSYFLAKEMIQFGNSVNIIAGSYSHLFHTLPRIKGRFTEECIDGINYTWVKLKPYKNSKSYGRILAMFQFLLQLLFFNTKSIPKPDVIVVSSMSSLPVLIAKWWSVKFKSKLIFEVRDLWPLTPIELGNSSKSHPFIVFMQWIENFAYKKSDKVVSVLPNAKEYMVQHGLTPEKFEYIPNGIDLAEIKSFDEQEKLPNLPKEKFLIGYVGALGIANAINYLIDAAIELKNNDEIAFVIVGKGDAKENLIEKVSHNDLKNVTFIDPINKSDVQTILHSFDVCYHGCRNHRLYQYGISPNKIFDYMLSGKPIIHACAASNDPIYEANCGITILPENPSKIVKAIHTLYTMNFEERKRMGENGLVYVKKFHDYKVLAQKYMELISLIS